MSVHITGGSLGFSLGPLLFAPFAQRFGLEWTPLLAHSRVWRSSLFFLSRLPHGRPGRTTTTLGLRALRPYARPLALLYFIVVLRTMTSHRVRDVHAGAADAAAGMSLAAAGSRGGGLSVRERHRRIPRRARCGSIRRAARDRAVAGLRGAVPVRSRRCTQGWAFVRLVAIGGFFLQSTLPVNVTFGQALAPVSAATVSSLMMGFAWGSGGLSVPFVGMVADRIGIEATLRGLGAGAAGRGRAARCRCPHARRRMSQTPPAADPL